MQSFALGLTAVLVLVLAIAVLLAELMIAGPKRRRFCTGCFRELEPSGRCRHWSCPKTPDRLP